MYNKRRSDQYGPELDKDYVLNNLELAVYLLNVHGIELHALEPDDKFLPEITDRNHCMNTKPDFSGEDREYLNKYGPSLSDIEGDKK